jgi:hypothetical protein
MTLSDRLQQARTRRLIEAGVLPSEYALKPEPAPAPAPAPVDDDAQGLFVPITIEVQSTGLHLVAEKPIELTDLPAGELSTRCPNCQALGHLDMVDLVGHTMHFTCETCGAMWQARHSVDESVTH